MTTKDLIEQVQDLMHSAFQDSYKRLGECRFSDAHHAIARAEHQAKKILIMCEQQHRQLQVAREALISIQDVGNVQANGIATKALREMESE